MRVGNLTAEACGATVEEFSRVPDLDLPVERAGGKELLAALKH